MNAAMRRKVHAQAYVCAGRMEDARRGLRLLIQDYPSLTCEKVRVAMLYSGPTMDRICDGLARAGLPLRWSINVGRTDTFAELPAAAMFSAVLSTVPMVSG